MSVTALIGLQWGDEGKGKVVDSLSRHMDFVVRGQGGANAGHTVILGDQSYVLHLVPSGVLSESAVPVIGNGVVIDPIELLAEIRKLEEVGLSLRDRLKVSHQAHMVLPTHRDLDRAQEQARGKGKLGTTGRGIGPCYTDKVSRCGLRMGDLPRGAAGRELLTRHMGSQRDAIDALGGQHSRSLADEVDELLEAFDALRPLISDTVALIHDAVDRDAAVLLEGAQGALLDLDHGSYPFVTSSSCCVGGLLGGSGVSPRALKRVIGVAKSYCTRVGAGPFPTEESGAVGEEIRQKGKEFGATTKRPRRCGWFDAVAVRRAIKTNGVSEMVLTKTDVLSGQPCLKVAAAYKSDASAADYGSGGTLGAPVPVYTEMAGFDGDLGAATSVDELPGAARDLIELIEAQCEVPVTLVSTGPERNQIVRRDPR